jgi:hydroxylaminobenzene mutase
MSFPVEPVATATLPRHSEGRKNTRTSQLRQSRRLLQAGILFMLYASFEGFVIQRMASPRIGLSTHTLAAMEGIFLLVQGLLWPRLRLSRVAALIAFWCSLYSALAILAAYTMAAVLGVGIETISLAGHLSGGLSHGNAFQETAIEVLSYSSAPTGIVCFALIFWGLRDPGKPRRRQSGDEMIND